MRLDRHSTGLTGWLLALAIGVAGAFPSVLYGQTAEPSPAASGPKEKDSPASRFPKNVELTAEVSPKSARPGETVTYKVTVTLGGDWHIYEQADQQPAQGPRATQFDLFGLDGLTPAGTWTPDHAAHRQAEPMFDNQVFGSFEKTVTWSIPIQVPVTAEAGTKSIRSQIYFQVCNAKSCNPPVRRSLSAVEVVVAGEPVAAAAVAPIVAKPPTPVALAPATNSGSGVQSEVDRKIGEGFLSFIVFCALGGLAALAMPCVWPMVPVTVNFFVKQSQAQGKRATSLAVVYCLAIIAIFTLVGVGFSALFEANTLRQLASKAWLNLLVAGIFLVFGLSLLGLFEIRLPAFLLNASSRGEGRGGLVGVIFMALTLTITSFTCTFPVVGGLLVVAASGKSYLYPVLGLAAFSTVLALPFFVLALAPGLLQKMPRSGDWMNAVKVVGGLVEIGAAFKFLNTAEIALGSPPESTWLDAEVLLAIWVVLAAVCGFYLLGMFRTDHDHGPGGIGPVRMLCGVGFLFVALYFAPALFGAPPRSRFYAQVVGLLPYDARLLAEARGSSSAEGGGDVKATSPDPELAQRQEKKFHGVLWGMSYDQAVETARTQNRPILVDFTGVNCANCRQMESEVMPLKATRDLLSQFVTVAQYTDSVPIDSITNLQRTALAEANADRQDKLVSDVTTPLYAVIDPRDGRVLGTMGGYVPAAQFQAFLTAQLQQFAKGAKAVAKAD
jgi:thiol:disulfide interchange protein DsbD